MDIQRISSVGAAFTPNRDQQPLREVIPVQSPAVVQTVSRNLSDRSAIKAESDKERVITRGFKDKAEGSFADKDGTEEQENSPKNRTGNRLDKKA